ncbi:hypothetical protein MPSEU_000078800 [Mayamaea pseudoterrestris]|nr:hypothetical protein MPSEU_000078800 [Mayamaea pseudoterrestris]
MSSEQFTNFQFNIVREQAKKDVFRKYEIIELLGQGSMGSVSKVRTKSDKIGGSAFRLEETRGPFGLLRKRKKRSEQSIELSSTYEYALKSIILDRLSSTFLDELKNEITILRSLDHPNIVRLHEVYTYKKQIFMVLDLCSGGDLYCRCPYSERQAARYTAQLVSAVCYMHDNGVVHRDLKWENIMFDGPSTLKVIDFGLSKKFDGRPKLMRDRVGTIYSMAPQVLQGIYSEKADLWSLGVIAFMMLGSRKPFYSQSRRQMVDFIMRAHYSFTGEIWDCISDTGKDFVSKLLIVDPKERMDANMALSHPWLVNREHWHDEKPSEQLLRKLDDSLHGYRYVSSLKKLALNVIAHRSTSEQIVELSRTFEAFDKNRNGIVTFEEFKMALERSALSDEVLKEVFDSVDINKDGHLRYTEFLAATVEAHGHISEDRIADAFDRLDSDGTGFISKKNLQEILGEDCNDEIEAIICSADENKDGKISYKEFLKAFRQQTLLTANQTLSMDDSSIGLDGSSLLGLDAKIPGGKYDVPLDETSMDIDISSGVSV